jgi:hypothetical protein
MIEIISLNILDEREKYSDKTISRNLRPLKMPNNLLDFHIEIDQS